MAIVTGTLLDFTTSVLGGSPRIVFTPSNPTAYTVAGVGSIFATKPVVVIPDPDGTFEVSLFANELGLTDSHYKVKVEWLDSGGNFISVDYFPWVLRVPWTGGRLADLLLAPWNPTLAWWGTEPPSGAPTPSTLWLDPDTGILSIWSN